MGRAQRASRTRRGVAAALGLLTAAAALSAAPAKADPPPGPTFACPGYSGLDSPNRNPVDQVLADVMAIPDVPATKVGNGRGDVDWAADPYANRSWRVWLNTLRWAGGLVEAYEQTGNITALNHAEALARDWLRDNPVVEGADERVTASTAHRTGFFLCLLAAETKAGRATGWLYQALQQHGDWLVAHYAGPVNIGLDQSLELLGVGCVLGNRPQSDLAVQRIDAHAQQVYDAQGVDDEQALGYAAYNYLLWRRTLDHLGPCGYSGLPQMRLRLRQALQFLAVATRPDGNLEQLGDTPSRPVFSPGTLPGTPAEFAATLGASGVKPLWTKHIFSAGYAFGRSGWGETRPFSQETYYSLRFGPGRRNHGHEDHMSMTYWARGAQVLADGGHKGYTQDAFRLWQTGPLAHNVEVVTNKRFVRSARTRLLRSVQTRAGDSYLLTDAAYAGVTRRRSVYLGLQDTFVATYDLTSSARGHSVRQLWHLPEGTAARQVDSTRVVGVRGDTWTWVVQVPFPGKRIGRGTMGIVEGQQSPLQGWLSPVLYTQDPAPVVWVRRDGRKTAVVTLVVPAPAGVSVRGRMVRDAGRRLHLGVTVGGKTTWLRFDKDNVLERDRGAPTTR